VGRSGFVGLSFAGTARLPRRAPGSKAKTAASSSGAASGCAEGWPSGRAASREGWSWCPNAGVLRLDPLPTRAQRLEQVATLLQEGRERACGRGRLNGEGEAGREKGCTGDRSSVSLGMGQISTMS